MLPALSVAGDNFMLALYGACHIIMCMRETHKTLSKKTMEKILIKGTCENCGYAYQGMVATPFPETKCPCCHQVTSNFDEAKEVEENDKAEGKVVEYNEVIFN
jgi:predicted Zn-ribbon and HTH transcriptional regulator